jgi:hypothetical protein
MVTPIEQLNGREDDPSAVRCCEMNLSGCRTTVIDLAR